jgi:outer membrane protein
MKRIKTLLPFAAALLLMLAGHASAQVSLAFVDTQALIRAHPAQEEIDRLTQSLDGELQELLQQRQDLLGQAQNGQLSPEQQELLQALSVTIETRRNEGVRAIREAAAPAEQAANSIIESLAGDQGYDLVLDIGSASGLVVFADDGVPDLTDAAVERMESEFGAP